MAHHQHTPELHEHVDPWHHHSAAEGLPQHEHTGVVNTSMLMRWFVLIVVVLAGVLVAISLYFTSTVTQLKAQLIETNVLAADANLKKAEAMKVLSMDGPASYSWSDADAGKVQIPIRQAMDKVVARYSGPAK